MAAHKRRTAFATPFVVTVALQPLAAGCPSSKQPPKPSEQPLVWTVWMKDMKCFAQLQLDMPANLPSNQLPPNPPPPQAVACPPGMASNVAMTIAQQPGKSYCTSRGNVVACPLPQGQEVVQPLNITWLIEKDTVGCHAEELSNCPKGADCNPPKPRYFPCPPGVDEEHPLVIAELPDATCVKVPNGCEDTGCAKEKVDCLPAGSKPTPAD